MASLMNDLTSNLKEQLACYKSLLQLQQVKSEVIIANVIEDLQKVSAVERELVGRVSRLERERERLIKDIAIVLNKKEKDLSILRLAELIGQDKTESKQLIEIREKLLDTIQELKGKNTQNANLVDQALNYVDFTMNALQTSRVMPSASAYAGKGQAVEQQSGQRYFDAKQ
ncbi:flagellar protein FlgN [Vallitalea okinawensis]|uniref:flagellar protein FlgN n=1 Tax=Vallitalea okinawensis TaxID=2078660 RepID=UPI0013009018|nr:flagellar protein FlgN [Vallitalea okinawensis]